MLIKPAFEDPINTIEDALNLPLDVMVPANTSVVRLAKMDPRPGMKVLQTRIRQFEQVPGAELPKCVTNG